VSSRAEHIELRAAGLSSAREAGYAPALFAAMADSDRPHPRSTRAVFALLGVTLLWGWTFVWMKEGVEAAESELGARGVVAGVGLFMALRFALAAVVLLALPAVRRGLDASAWRAGAAIGAPLLVGFLLQMFGLRGVSPAVSAFLTSLYVLFTALILLARTRRAPGLALIIGALLATFGAGFIGGPPQLSYGLGELLTIACAFVFAIHILVTDYATKRAAPMPATFATMLFVAAGSAVVIAIGCALDGGPTGAGLARLAMSVDFARPMLLASLFATVIALSLMNVFQRELDPVRAAIVYALEPVWAACISIALGREHVSGWLWLGGGALLAGNLIAELGPQIAARRGRSFQS
jgi:drug/metabolite transporter (DMT)-like permease